MAWGARLCRNKLVAVVMTCVAAVAATSLASAQAAPEVALPAPAEASARQPAEYRQIVQRAVREFDTGNYAEARGLFSRAHELSPSARTHLGLGLTAYELRNYGTGACQRV